MKLLAAVVGISLCCSLSCLEMEGVHLSKNKTYIRLQDDEPAVLECQYTLKEGNTSRSVTWYHDDQFIFAWIAAEPARLGANLTNTVVATGRSDGHLEILKPHMTFGGNYRCEVTTSAGATFKSYDYQLLIVDYPRLPITTSVEVVGCSVLVSLSAPAIAPKARPICGAYIPSHQYVLSAISWLATPHYNGSVAYSLDKEEMKINQMPTDAIIRCEIGISKIDGSYVQLMYKSYNITEIWERGCPPLDIEDTKTLNFEHMRHTCRNEIAPRKGAKVAKAHIQCKEPLRSKYSYLVNEVTLVCEGSKWTVDGEQTWNHHDNLICVEADSTVGTPAPQLPTIKPPVAVRGHGTNGGTSLSSSIIIGAMLALVLGCGLALRFNLKKPRRYVD